jgi:hypothetical protein
LDQVAQWISINSKSFDLVYWNMLHEIWYFSISRLPRTVKTVLETHLTTVAIPQEFKQEFARIVDFMNGGASSNGVEMLEAMRQIDQRRGQNLAEAMPKLAELIGYK